MGKSKSNTFDQEFISSTFPPHFHSQHDKVLQSHFRIYAKVGCFKLWFILHGVFNFVLGNYVGIAWPKVITAVILEYIWTLGTTQPRQTLVSVQIFRARNSVRNYAMHFESRRKYHRRSNNDLLRSFVHVHQLALLFPSLHMLELVKVELNEINKMLAENCDSLEGTYLHRTRCSFQHVHEMINYVNECFGLSHLMTVLLSFYTLLTYLNFIYQQIDRQFEGHGESIHF